LFAFTVSAPLFTVSPDARAVSDATPSFLFHVIVTPVAVGDTFVWSRKRTGVSTRFEIIQEMNKNDLKDAAGISAASIAKLGKGANIITDVLLEICETMDCKLEDIMETIQD